MIRIGREIQCLPYVGFFFCICLVSLCLPFLTGSKKNKSILKMHRMYFRYFLKCHQQSGDINVFDMPPPLFPVVHDVNCV